MSTPKFSFKPSAGDKSSSADGLKFGETHETNEARLESRLKQIRFGKNTAGYDFYLQAVPKNKRIYGNPAHPRTPDVSASISKRAFDGRVRSWRRALHLWDEGRPDTEVAAAFAKSEQENRAAQSTKNSEAERSRRERRQMLGTTASSIADTDKPKLAEVNEAENCEKRWIPEEVGENSDVDIDGNPLKRTRVSLEGAANPFSIANLADARAAGEAFDDGYDSEDVL